MINYVWVFFILKDMNYLGGKNAIRSWIKSYKNDKNDQNMLILMSHSAEHMIPRKITYSNIHEPPPCCLCLLASLLQLANYVVRFITVTLTRIREHQIYSLHFTQHREGVDAKFPPSAPLGQPTGLTACRSAACRRKRPQVVYKAGIMGLICLGSVESNGS